MTPKVSIIIPVYNTEKYIRKCLTSLLMQSLSDIEVIVVDDHGTDASIDICREIADKDNRLKVVRSDFNCGCGMARNFGLDIAKGKYVAFVDSDDYLDREAYRLLYEAAEAHDADMVCFFPDRVTDDDAKPVDVSAGLKCAVVVDGEAEKQRVALNFFSPRLERTHRELIAEGSSCMKLIKRSLFEDKSYRFPCIPHMLSEDYVFSYKLMQISRNPIVILPYRFYHYRITPDSITTNPNPDRIYNAIKSAQLFSDTIKQYTDNPDCQNYPRMYVIDYIWVAMRLLFETSKTEAEKKKWFLKLADNQYMLDIKKVFPFKKLNMKHRIGCYAVYSHNYWLMKVIITWQLKLRRMIGRL